MFYVESIVARVKAVVAFGKVLLDLK